MKKFSILLMIAAASSVDSSCPWRGRPVGNATSAFYATSGIYDDTLELQREHKHLTGAASTSEKVLHFCNANLKCDPDQKYRFFNGSCTNLRNPEAGSRNQCHRRIIEASYRDGVSKPPVRPSITKIFNLLQARRKLPAGPVNTMFATVSQFLVHDITQTALSMLKGNHDCCSRQNKNLPQCSLRIVTTNADHYKQQGVRCMSFVRAARCPCSAETERDSLNYETAYVDLSHVYLDGSGRQPNSPYLKRSHSVFSGDLPQLESDPNAKCYAPGRKCFRGDHRMNQQQGISMHHVVFEKLHNQLAKKLTKLNPQWSTETVFQETRKIMIARWQYVIFKEMAEYIFDKDFLRSNNVHMSQLLQGTKVDPNSETVTFAESVHSEGRCHFLPPGKMAGLNLLWLDSSKYYSERKFLKNLLKAQLDKPANLGFPLEPALAQEILKRKDEPLGLSMLMINLQRGRDTGLPNLADMVSWAFGTRIESYDDLAKLAIHSDQALDLLKELYPRVHDVDLWVGGHLQRRNGTGVAPFLHQKIRMKQHYSEVYGDRFFFTHEGVFTEAQRNSIAQSSTYAQLLCEAFKLKRIPKNAFENSANKTIVPCSSFPKLKLRLWKDESSEERD